MKWILTSLIFGVFGGGITFLLTQNLNISIISTISVLILALLLNPKTRYMKAFYAFGSPLLFNYYFILEGKTTNFNFELGWKEIDKTSVFVLGLISLSCLILDFLERNDKLKGTFLAVKKNKVGNITGNNISINQSNDK
ncbi:MAG: hypothetical protein ACI8ZO_000483 [Flavobacteriales bacterium]|jgi:hypothetical protein